MSPAFKSLRIWDEMSAEGLEDSLGKLEGTDLGITVEMDDATFLRVWYGENGTDLMLYHS